MPKSFFFLQTSNYSYLIIIIMIIWNNPQRIDKGTRRLRNQRTSRDYLDYSIIKIGQNTERSPGDLEGLAVTQTPVRNN